MKLTVLVDDVRIVGKARPRSTLIIPGVAKARLAGLPRNLWPSSRVHMPDNYTKALKEIRELFGEYRLGDVPHVVRVWATLKMPASWTKAKRAETAGAVVVAETKTTPDADNALGTILDAMFPQLYEGSGRQKKLVAGTGDGMIPRVEIELRWWWYDSIRVEVEELPRKPQPWPWLREKGAKTLF